MLHELTHRYIKTLDHPMPDEAYISLGATPPIASTTREVARHLAYGPRYCNVLAQTRPDIAITNADNYRLFCEDAFFYEQG